MQHVVSQLITKKEELQGELNFYKQKVEQLQEILGGINVSIKVFDPDFNLKEVNPKRFTGNTHYFKRGESHILILDTLRESKHPLRTSEVTKMVMKKKKLDVDNVPLFEKIRKTLFATLKKQEENNLIKITDQDDYLGCSWEIA